MLLNTVFLALSLSVDSLGVGITYGIKDTKISFLPKTILFLTSFSITLLSIWIGKTIILFLPKEFVSIIGTILLILMGIWIIYQGLKSEKNNNKTEDLQIKKKTRKIFRFFIKPLGITIKIIRDPISSDLDQSKSIDIKEAIYLGLAMSMDSLCSGIGISIIGVNSILFPMIVASFQILFISIGNILGKKIQLASRIPSNIWSILSGILLIIIGLAKLFL
jgi:putative sporulation protein YtaF